MSALLEALRTRQPLPTATLPCVSDADPLPGDEDDERDPEAGADVAIELIGRACRALPRDRAAAAELLRSAAALLAEIADEVEA